MIRALILCALLAGVGGAEDCLPLNTPMKNVPEGYCVAGLTWCKCPDTIEQKIEKLEKRVEELEKKLSPTEETITIYTAEPAPDCSRGCISTEGHPAKPLR